MSPHTSPNTSPHMSPLQSLQITRVLANAGSGKTHKLSADFLRVAHSGLVEGDPARVESILATTFTRASARDIRNKFSATKHVQAK